ncbi:MAG: hypothetical protein LBK04_06025, partial [Clostridiales Family XIII bacterium]|nr:hypothetical protein [Clostridiales Family XIII bacterium]
EDFTELLGHPLPESGWDEDAPIGLNDTIAQSAYKGKFARFINGCIRLASKFSLLIGKPRWANNAMFITALPFRGVSRLSGGVFDAAMRDALLAMVNGHFLTGLGSLVRSAITKNKRRKTV